MDKNLYSVVIPVFNSASIITSTVEKTAAFFADRDLDCEIILVNDGSFDESWEAIRKLATDITNVTAIDLLKNYGQHNANLCGFRHAKGDYVITMDDDLQNPPEEIAKLIEGTAGGYDLVIGQFREKKHSPFRRLGSRLIGIINRKVFLIEKDLALTNFRIIHRDVIDRVCAAKSSSPYIPGLLLTMSGKRRNVLVDHHARKHGKSNYGLYRITRLVGTILFNNSSLPLRLMAAVGFLVSGFSFLLSIFYFLSAIFSGSTIPGWATLVILLSFFNGVLILLVSIVGEYVVRFMRETNASHSYYINDLVE